MNIFGEDRGDDIDDAFRRRSETRDAIVVAVLAGNSYRLTDCMTGGDFDAEVLQSVSYQVGKRVTVRHDAAGRAAGRKPEIIGSSQAAGNGLIVGTLAYTVPKSAATITRLPTLPLRLVKGGQNVVVTIFGEQLSGVATYGTPNITDSVAQLLLDDAALVIRPQALIGCTPGRYSLTFAGQTVPNFFEVT